MAFGGFFDTQGKEDRQNNCKAQGQVVLHVMSTPFYAAPVFIHTYMTSRMYNYTRPA
jgi:hypothetical protein